MLIAVWGEFGVEKYRGPDRSRLRGGIGIAGRSYAKAKERSSRSVGFNRLVSELPEDLVAEAKELRKEGLTVRLIVLALDGGRKKCVCGNNTPPGPHGFRFEDYCSETCSTIDKENKASTFESRLKNSKSSYKVVRREFGDRGAVRLTLRCEVCGNTKTASATSLGQSKSTCVCGVGEKITKAQTLRPKQYDAEYLSGRNIVRISKFRRMNSTGRFRCETCSTEWETTFANVAYKSGCPGKCARDKYERNHLAKHGVRHSSQRPSVRQKYKKTMLARFGVEHPSKCPKLHDKNRSYKRKEYKLGDRIVEVQGYEPQALEAILNRGITAEQIECGVGSSVPTIDYKEGGKTRTYHPDIYIPHLNRIIEVKSEYTFKRSVNNLKAKARGCKDAGFKFTVMVLDKKGNEYDLEDFNNRREGNKSKQSKKRTSCRKKKSI